jgi:hypothetical protein
MKRVIICAALVATLAISTTLAPAQTKAGVDRLYIQVSPELALEVSAFADPAIHAPTTLTPNFAAPQKAVRLPAVRD